MYPSNVNICPLTVSIMKLSTQVLLSFTTPFCTPQTLVSSNVSCGMKTQITPYNSKMEKSLQLSNVEKRHESSYNSQDEYPINPHPLHWHTAVLWESGIALWSAFSCPWNGKSGSKVNSRPEFSRLYLTVISPLSFSLTSPSPLQHQAWAPLTLPGTQSRKGWHHTAAVSFPNPPPPCLPSLGFSLSLRSRLLRSPDNSKQNVSFSSTIEICSTATLI